MSHEIDRLTNDFYTTKQVTKAIGRQLEQWCRIRHKYIAKYDLKFIKVGRQYYYEKEPVNRMIDDLLKNGDSAILRSEKAG